MKNARKKKVGRCLIVWVFSFLSDSKDMEDVGFTNYAYYLSIALRGTGRYGQGRPPAEGPHALTCPSVNIGCGRSQGPLLQSEGKATMRTIHETESA